MRFRKHARPELILRCRADIVFPRARVAVFVDGCFWHRCPEHGVRPRTNSSYWDAKISSNVQRDTRNTQQLTASGWIVIRVWEHEPVQVAADRVQEAVAAQLVHLSDDLTPSRHGAEVVSPT
jgi:DNA mismatch endonuclease, patch repair protein